jgi:hypothetical protein
MSSSNKKFHSAKAGIKRHTVYDPEIYGLPTTRSLVFIRHYFGRTAEEIAALCINIMDMIFHVTVTHPMTE